MSGLPIGTIVNVHRSDIIDPKYKIAVIEKHTFTGDKQNPCAGSKGDIIKFLFHTGIEGSPYTDVVYREGGVENGRNILNSKIGRLTSADEAHSLVFKIILELRDDLEDMSMDHNLSNCEFSQETIIEMDTFNSALNRLEAIVIHPVFSKKDIQETIETLVCIQPYLLE